MEFYEFGNIQNPKVLLIHGMAITWECFEPLIDQLSKHYYLIVPSLNGHNPNDEKEFECLDYEVQKIEEYILSTYLPKLHGAYGFSMGGTILLKLLMNGKIHIPNVILDAAYYLPLGIYSKASSAFLTNILKEIRENRPIHPFIKQLLLYANVDIEALKRAIYPGVSSKSIYNCLIELARFHIHKPLSPSAEVVYWYGSKEIFPAKSVKYLKQHHSTLHVKIFENLGHGELITKFPEKAVEEMRQIYQ